MLMRLRSLLAIVALASLPAGLSACRPGDPPGATTGAAADAPPDPLGPPSQAEVPTTAGSIAMDNLNGQIDVLEKLLTTRPTDVESRLALFALLGTRAKVVARVADAERAVAVAEDLVQRAPQRAAAYVARAVARTSMHRFPEALADLAEAEKHGAKPAELISERATILEAQGDLDGALRLRHAASEARADPGTLGTEASLLGQLGKTDEAATLFNNAARDYRGVSPFPITWLFLQQGLLWERAGNTARARAYFAAALDRLPAFAHAASHLATLEPPAAGVALLAPAVAASDDPEIELVLASRLRASGDVAQADARTAHVRARYAELVERHPEAYAEHAGWFWLDEAKDPAKALELARKNLAVRKTEKAYRLAVLAALAAGARPEACTLGQEAAQVPHVSEMLKGIAADACKPAAPPK
jgi:tetratricopeptide (TPR) repeat protein